MQGLGGATEVKGLGHSEEAAKATKVHGLL